MIKYLMHRVLSTLLVMWIAATVAFFALGVLPGDAVKNQLVQSGVGSDLIAEHQAVSGLDDPIGMRYLRFLFHTVQGDLGVSLLSGEAVVNAILRNFEPTFTLATSAIVVACTVGIMLGTVGALRIPLLSWWTRIVINLALSMPIYWTGTLAIYVFTVQLRLLSSAGAGRLDQVILPVLVLGFHTSGAIARVTQNNVHEVLGADFVRTARAKGLSEVRIIGVHVLRAALPPVVGVIALQAGFLFSGTVITETLFVRPGIGRLLLEAVIQQDYPVVLGVVVLSASVYSFVTTLGEIVTRVLDPRVVF